MAEEMHGFADSIGCVIKDGLEFDRTIDHKHAEDAECKAEVTHAVNNEGFDGSSIGAFARVPETDQQI